MRIRVKSVNVYQTASTPLNPPSIIFKKSNNFYTSLNIFIYIYISFLNFYHFWYCFDDLFAENASFSLTTIVRLQILRLKKNQRPNIRE